MRKGIAAASQTNPDMTAAPTDGFTPWPDLRPGRAVIAALIGRGRDEVPDWAHSAEVEL